MKNRDKKDRRRLLILVLIFIALAAGIIAAGYRYYVNYAANYRVQIENQLSSIADLKAGELLHWRQERMGDASLFYKNPLFSALVQRYLKNAGDAEAEGQLRTRLGRFQNGGQYERIMLLDAAYNKKMVVPEGPERPVSFVSPATAAILQDGQVAFEDYYYNEIDQKIYLKVMVPILDPGDERQVIGFLALRTDPAAYLYPMLQRWPTPSATAESLVVRRDGDDVLYLNELKFQKDTALKLRIPLTKIELPAVKGALGYEGVMEGSDYRGVQVIAAVRGVPDSPWILVARIDKAEVYAPLTQMLWVIMVLIGALLIGAGAGVGLVWRGRSQLYYKERAKTAEALDESNEKFRKAFSTSPDSMSITRIADGLCIAINKSFTQLMGYEEAEIVGKSILGMNIWSNPAERQKMVEGLKSTGVVENLEAVFLTKAGMPRNGLMSAVAIELNGVPHVLNTTRDITEIKQAEEKLKIAFEELQNSNAELERFTYTISHDLKSPLVTIKTFLGYLRQDIPGPDAARVEKDMLFMEGAADKMSRLLDELLEMSRIGRVVNTPVTVSFRALVQEALDLVEGGVRKRGVEVKISDEGLTLHADRQRLVEIWQNLLENAVKFMGEQESPRIDIGFERKGTDTVFFVRDNGMGIDPRYKSRVFNLFDKLDAKAEGTGLGLAIVRRIVELYKGAAWFESAGAGQGSCFFFTLPSALQDESPY